MTPAEPSVQGEALAFDRDGADHRPGAAAALLPLLDRLAAEQAGEAAGVRLYGNATVRDLLVPGGVLHRLAAERAGDACRPVRAILFDKTPGQNWTLGWHQDRTIALRDRHDVAGWGPWTLKAGAHHVEPPFAVIETMVTMRVHLDDVDATNAPLQIVPGSHRLGRVPALAMNDIVDQFGTAKCLARRGDVWLYATAIIHASGRARRPGHRRVLQIDFSPQPLPEPLTWLGV